jgi:signal transduction histidine kinase
MFLSRADVEARRPDLESIPLDGWLRERLDAWSGPRRPDLVYESDASTPCRVLVHPPLLGELLDNLLDNAAKYSPLGTPITVRLSRRDVGVRFTVADVGPGIELADLPHVFEPFFRAETARLGGTRGVGLGLSVAARIANAFGGRIAADGSPGGGATFVVDLPEATAPQDDRATDRP